MKLLERLAQEIYFLTSQYWLGIWIGKNMHLKDLWKSIIYTDFQPLSVCAPILKIKYISFGPINNIFI